MGTKHYYPDALYAHFQSLSPADLHALIRFYERYEAEIDLLPLEQHFAVRYSYANALFDLGESNKYLCICDELLEDAIIHNIQYIEGSSEDVYVHTLYQKTLAHYRIQQQDEAVKTAWALARIMPHNIQYRRLLRRCLMASRPRWVRECFAIGVFVGLLAIVFAFSNILFLEVFYSELSPLMHQFEYLSFVLAGSVLLLGFLGHWYAVEKGMRSLPRKSKFLR